MKMNKDIQFQIASLPAERAKIIYGRMWLGHTACH